MSGFAKHAIVPTIQFCIWFILLLALSGCTREAREFVDDAGVRLVDVLTIGDNETLGSDYFFGNPVAVVSDSLGRIYVADQLAMNVKVYDAAGSFIRTIGSRGQGPGEFQYITTAAIGRDGHLFVADDQVRRISKFRTDGEFVVMYSMTDMGISWPHSFRPLDEGGFVASTFSYAAGDSQDIVHVFDSSLVRRHSFGPTSLLGDTGAPFTRAHSTFSSGHIAITRSGDILFLPSLYNGLWYRMTEDGNTWRPPLEIVGRDRRASHSILSNPPYPRHASVISGRIRAAALVHREGLGIFELKDGRTILFIGEDDFGNASLVIEVFSSDDEHLGTTRVSLDRGRHGGDFPVVVSSMGSDEDFYFIDRREYPIIRKVRLEFAQQERSIPSSLSVQQRHAAEKADMSPGTATGRTPSTSAETEQGQLKGQVVDDKGDPLGRVNVVALDYAVGGVTADDGSYALRLPAGHVDVRFSLYPFFRAETLRVEIMADSTTVETMILYPAD